MRDPERPFPTLEKVAGIVKRFGPERAERALADRLFRAIDLHHIRYSEAVREGKAPVDVLCHLYVDEVVAGWYLAVLEVRKA